MRDKDVVAEAVEAMGARTFGADEIAVHIVAAMGGSSNASCQLCPLVIDLSGGLGQVKGLPQRLAAAKKAVLLRSAVSRAVKEDGVRDAVVSGPGVVADGRRDAEPLRLLRPRANLRLQLPELPDYDRDVQPLAAALEGKVDLSRVVVVTGFAELGPHGSSRTRWEREMGQALSLEGSVELAWMMGLIRHKERDENHSDRNSGGWVDAETQQAVHDGDVARRYEAVLRDHTGLRKIEPGLCNNGYDPERKESLHEVVLQRDLGPFEVSSETAVDLARRHGHRCIVSSDAKDSSRVLVRLKAAAVVMVPQYSRFNRGVAGQIPTGWLAKRYSISQDIINQTDPITLFSLVCTVEALLCSGIVNPYELYQNVHLSEVGICLGSSMGGLSSLRKMHRDRYLKHPEVQGDVLQETFINTTGAWINMLLASSAGPIRTPVGACATSLESLDTAYDLISLQKVKVCIIGGSEDFVEDVSFEFASMKATCDTDAEYAAGRAPSEMSRPMASSRSGFVEAQGAGVQIVTSAELALRLGLHIYCVVAYSNLSGDGAGRSVPAPDKGILTNAREMISTAVPLVSSAPIDTSSHSSPQSRRQHLDSRLGKTCSFVGETLDRFEVQGDYRFTSGTQSRRTSSTINTAVQDQDQHQREAISPIRSALATWNLGVDDIAFASLHGTSTVKNDTNEASVIQAQMRHLGRRQGNLLPCICQKWLTGHSKGAAGAWMLNGALQAMDSGVIPGNWNADNVDAELRQHDLLVFPGIGGSLEGRVVDACSVTSFGFGLKGAQAILVHPRHLFAAAGLGKEGFEAYAQARADRWRRATRAFVEGIVEETLVGSCIKDNRPYGKEEEVEVLLDPTRRFG
ncbi:hypothetical protein MCOR25_010512 [Pyricularia grisea]|nr:hypothetical protein MCOR25_010512 [Pyricularia grisea]